MKKKLYMITLDDFFLTSFQPLPRPSPPKTTLSLVFLNSNKNKPIVICSLPSIDLTWCFKFEHFFSQISLDVRHWSNAASSSCMRSSAILTMSITYGSLTSTTLLLAFGVVLPLVVAIAVDELRLLFWCWWLGFGSKLSASRRCRRNDRPESTVELENKRYEN